MNIVTIKRYKTTDNYTLGECYVNNCYLGKSLERGWQDNKSNISCVPEGEYPLKLEYSNRFNKDLWELKDVPNRSECKFHSANYWYQLEGCITLGNKVGDINNDGYPDVINSRDTMEIFSNRLSNSKDAKLIIINKY